jgi:hypothetical protein
MKEGAEDPERENRIIMEIVVDAYGPQERAMGWYCYLESTLTFPFTAKCISRRITSPLRPRQRVKIIGLADSDECVSGMFVLIEWEDDELAVPLEQLDPAKVDEETRQAIEDWRYWKAQGYSF